MARTKFTGPRDSPSETPPTPEAANDKADNHPTAAPSGAPTPASAAASKAPGQARVTKRARGTPLSISKDVLVLYEALTYGVDVKVSHGAVARAVGIKEPAARMRYNRLMKRIGESLADRSDQSAQGVKQDQAAKGGTVDGKGDKSQDADKK